MKRNYKIITKEGGTYLATGTNIGVDGGKIFIYDDRTVIAVVPEGAIVVSSIVK